MSTTPPKKGKKRAPPSTPTGRPPAKASKPSTPTALTGEDAPRGFASSLDTSALPAIPPFRPTPGSTSAPSGTADIFSQHGSDTAMDNKDDEGSSTLPANTVSFATVADDIDDEEVETSFKELLDWMRYLGQYARQRGRLTALLTEAVDNLRTLSGETGREKPASYAAAAATSAVQTQGPSKAKPRPAQTVKQSKRQIQHAITRFERVSKELPGAPRDALLNIVARSDLKTAPPPLPKVPGPKKRALCLVKGI